MLFTAVKTKFWSLSITKRFAFYFLAENGLAVLEIGCIIIEVAY